MDDLSVLEDFFMVPEVADRMCWTVVPSLAGQAVRRLQGLARDPETHPDDVMRAVDALKIAIGPVNLAAVLAHELWDEWCPSPCEPADTETGVVMWAGRRGYVKGVESDADGQLGMTLHSVRVSGKAV
jgi:hypothetical protein